MREREREREVTTKFLLNNSRKKIGIGAIPAKFEAKRRKFRRISIFFLQHNDSTTFFREKGFETGRSLSRKIPATL